jgi:hypothetical protein
MSPISVVHEDKMVNEEYILHGNRLAVMESLIKEIKDDYLVEIKAQVQKTNGRVNSLEQIAIRNKSWIHFLWIAVSALGALLLLMLSQHIALKP